MSQGLWKQAAVRLAGLGAFFYLSYGLANWLAAQRESVPNLRFEFERQIPFIAESILPYWSINLFYALSLFLCGTLPCLRAHTTRLFLTQCVAISCFILLPLQVISVRPETDGLPGFMFDALTSFDRPYNQAPSLHIALLILLWDLYRRIVPRGALWLLHGWSLLIGLSVLTTYQHHFIDIPTGAALGLLVVWLVPLHGVPRWRQVHAASARETQLARRYLLLSTLVAVLAVLTGPSGWWLFWPVLSLLMVAANYQWFGASGFVAPDAFERYALTWLLAPYRLGATLNRWWWLRRVQSETRLDGSVSFAPFSSADDTINSVIHLCAEFPPRESDTWVPMLDLVCPRRDELDQAMRLARDHLQNHGRVRFCCALGRGRSATTAAAFLVASGRCRDLDSAIAAVRAANPWVQIDAAALHAVWQARSA